MARGNHRRRTTGRTRFPVDLFISYLADEKRRSRQDSRLGSIASDDTDAVILESSANARQIAGVLPATELDRLSIVTSAFGYVQNYARTRKHLQDT